MHVPRHAAAPRPSRIKLLAWLVILSLWPVTRLTEHLFHPAWLDVAADTGAALTLVAGLSARRLRSLKFRRIQAAAPAQYELLSARVSRADAAAAECANRLDDLERAWELVHGPSERPDLRVLRGGRS